MQLGLGQHLSMTPQLQQAIRLLQLSTLELQQEIQEALESNLMLETEEEGSGDTPTEGSAATIDEKSSDDGTPSHDSQSTDTLPDQLPDDLPVDTDWDTIYDSAPPATASSGTAAGDGEADLLQFASSAPTLTEHLAWQLNMAGFDQRETLIAEAIIDAIDADGYFRSETGDIAAILEAYEVTEAEVEQVLKRIHQEFDPSGIGARDLRECLLLQLRQLPSSTPFRTLGIQLIDQHFEALGRQDRARIRRSLKCADEEVDGITRLIRTLDPRPGGRLAEPETRYVVPDVFVSRKQGRWLVELNPEATTRLRINHQYAGMIQRGDSSSDNQTMKNHLQEARWFIKSVNSRNETLLRVATRIVEFQRAYFDYGDEAMKPLILRDIAEALEMHESTISRVTMNKFMHTPRGTFELKYFFSSHVSTSGGGECSATAIRALIRKLVAEEPPAKPLSDSRIASILQEQGINVARRTVAKYRESMAIAPSNERKRLA